MTLLRILGEVVFSDSPGPAGNPGREAQQVKNHTPTRAGGTVADIRLAQRVTEREGQIKRKKKRRERNEETDQWLRQCSPLVLSKALCNPM